ncbi:MAG: glycerophosphodiester phosphodiesterase family protein [Actinomycetes bacterium]
MKAPLVIAHRGACGYRPENTIESFELGIAQGSDGIEFDLVTTSDEQLVIRHENALSETTDIATKPEFSEFKRTGEVEEVMLTDWFSEDLTLAQIKSLRAIERLPEIRPGSAIFDGQFQIPTFSELLDAPFIAGKILVVEIKQGTHLDALTQSVATLVTKAIVASSVIARDVKLIIESFSFDLLLQAKAELIAAGITAKYFLAIDEAVLDSEWLGELAKDVDGISLSTHLLFSEASWVETAHANSLEIWVFTARAERAETSIDEYYEKFIVSGVDGIFADQPDLLRRVLADRG